MTSVVIDASVLIAAFIKDEPGWVESRNFFRNIDPEIRIQISTFAVWEFATALFRRTKEKAGTENAIDLIVSMPGFTGLTGFDDPLIQKHFPELMFETRLRAADLFYVALAKSTNSLLVSLDTEMIKNSQGIVAVKTPAQYNLAY